MPITSRVAASTAATGVADADVALRFYPAAFRNLFDIDVLDGDGESPADAYVVVGHAMVAAPRQRGPGA
jgi:hypothetical protein